MDISRTRVVLRERAVVDVLDLGVRFIVQHWAVYAKLTAIVLPPFFIASWLLARLIGPIEAWAFALFASALVGAPFTLLASRLVFEDEVRIRPALASAVRALPKLVAIRVGTMVIGGLGLALFTFPGVWFLALMLFVVEILVLERSGMLGAFARSSRIVRRESSEAIMTLLVLALLHLVVVIVADGGGRMLITALLESRAPTSLWENGWSPLSLLGFWLFVPYAVTARFLVYLDVRTRSEGWDIQTRFAALAVRSAEDARRAA